MAPPPEFTLRRIADVCDSPRQLLKNVCKLDLHELNLIRRDQKELTFLVLQVLSNLVHYIAKYLL